MNRFLSKAQNLLSSQGSSQMADEQGFAAYPPNVKHIEILGYIEEANGIFHSRDIGRSFELFGKIYLKFGDTFCNNSDGDFVGLANNTLALVQDPTGQPLKSKYLDVEDNGAITPFIQLTPEEKQLEEQQRGRVVLWAFGGVVERDDGTGRLWYQKNIDHGCGNVEYIGTGMAEITESDDPDHQPIARRMDDLMFGPDEPRMGTFSVIKQGDHVYLYGDRPDGKIVLSRVHKDSIANKEAHAYWTGSDWVPNDWQKAVPVIEGMQQGAIVSYPKLFGESRPFVFVGTSKWADSKVYMGAEKNLQGPWKLEPVCKVEGIKETTAKGKWMYCIYPQLWAEREEEGNGKGKAELVVSWSERYPGGVVVARIRFVGAGEERVEGEGEIAMAA